MSAGGEGGDRRSIFGRLWARFGDVAKSLGIVGEEDVREALLHQEERKRARDPHKKIGEILVEKGKMGDGHVKKVLAEQKRTASGKAKAASGTRKKAKAAKPKKKAKTKAKKKGKKKARKKAKRG